MRRAGCWSGGGGSPARRSGRGGVWPFFYGPHAGSGPAGGTAGRSRAAVAVGARFPSWSGPCRTIRIWRVPSRAGPARRRGTADRMLTVTNTHWLDDKCVPPVLPGRWCRRLMLRALTRGVGGAVPAPPAAGLCRFQSGSARLRNRFCDLLPRWNPRFWRRSAGFPCSASRACCVSSPFRRDHGYRIRAAPQRAWSRSGDELRRLQALTPACSADRQATPEVSPLLGAGTTDHAMRLARIAPDKGSSSVKGRRWPTFH